MRPSYNKIVLLIGEDGICRLYFLLDKHLPISSTYCIPTFETFAFLLTYCGEDRGGVVEGAGELPGHARLIGLLHEHQLLQEDEVHAVYVVLGQELGLERCKQKNGDGRR